MSRVDDGPRPDATLPEVLAQQSADHLRSLLNLLPRERPRPTRKAELAAAIARRLAGDLPNDLWGRLTRIQRHAVSEVLYSTDGAFHPQRFQAKYGALPGGVATEPGREPAASLLSLLLYAGSSYSGGTAIIPADLKERLRAFVPRPPPLTMAAQDELPETIAQPRRGYYGKQARPVDQVPLTRRDMERAAQQDLLAVLRLVDRGSVAVSAKTRQATAAAMRRIAAVLYAGDFFDPAPRKQHSGEQTVGPIKAFAWPMLLQTARLAEPHGSKLALTRAGRAALGTPPAETLRLLWGHWLGSTSFDEFRRIEAIKGQRGRGARALTAARHRRDSIVEALEECPADRWVSCDELARFMQAADLEFSITRNPWSLYIGESRYGSLGYGGYHDWGILQGRYLLGFLFEYAATLGVVDVAYTDPLGARLDFTQLGNADELDFLSRYDGLRYFRLTALGTWCLGRAESYQPRPPAARASITVFPDLRLQVQGTALTKDEALLLETYARQEAEDVWRLDRDKTLAALENGSRVDELREYLTTRDEQPLPETVEGFLDTTARRSQALVAQGTALLIECADAALADQFATHEPTARLCRRAGARGLVVRTEAEGKFRKAIRELGYGMPRR